MGTASTLASAPRRLWYRIRRLKRRRRAQKALAHIDRGLQCLRVQGIQVPQEVLDARWHVARVVRQHELDQQLREAENVVVELEDAGLTVHALQVSASLNQDNLGFSSGLDIHVSTSYEEYRWAQS